MFFPERAEGSRGGERVHHYLNLEVLGSVALGLGMNRFFFCLSSLVFVSWLLVWKVTVLVFDFSVSGLWLDSFVRAWMDGRVLFELRVCLRFSSYLVLEFIHCVALI
jgi:hypothetical protein